MHSRRQRLKTSVPTNGLQVTIFGKIVRNWVQSQANRLLQKLQCLNPVAADRANLEQDLERAISATANRLIEGQDAHPLNSQFSHYRLLELLGSGGASQVYMAEDLQLGTKVALKFLPAAFSEDHARVRRFEKEARGESALNHPNIAATYEIGNVDGRWFIAMEYVPGESLSARITRGPIPVPEALPIAGQTCRGTFRDASMRHSASGY